jgi:hypothetical protein
MAKNDELALPADWHTAASTRQPLNLLVLLVGPFIVAACSVAYLEGWNYAVRGLGVVLAAAFILRAVFSRTGIAPESVLYLAWVGWCLVPGVGGLINPPLFWEHWFTLVQVLVLIAILAGFVENRRSLSFCLGSLLCAVFIVGMYGILSGEWRHAEQHGERVTSLTLNANAFGYSLLLATMSLAYFWTAQPGTKPFRRLLLICGLVLCAAGIWASGSRKAVLSLVLFYPMWIWFCYRTEVVRRPAMLIFVVMILASGAVALSLGMKDSATGERFIETWELMTGRRTRGGGSERLVLYGDAIRVFLANPVFGIGMGQFIYLSRLVHASHSEIMEVATGSGLPGLILYFGIIVVFWRRCGRIARWSGDPDEARLARLFRVCVVVLFLIALGRTNYANKEHWVFMASLIGYTLAVQRRLLAGDQYPQASTPQLRSWPGYRRLPQA